MNKLKGFRLAAVGLTALFFGPGLVQAQRSMPMASAQSSGRMLSARPANTVRVSPAHPPAAVRARGRVTAAGAPLNDPGNVFASGLGGFPFFGQGPINSTPGFGFNNANLDDLGITAAIDPETQWRLAFAERFLRDRGFGGFFGGGYILDGGGYYSAPEEPSSEPAAAPPAPQPQIIVVQAPGANQQATAPAPQAEQPPLPDVGQFTLVLRDGTRIEAVAFTHKSDTIVYITTDGSRRTLAVADLDSAATQRVNQERGTPVNLSL